MRKIENKPLSFSTTMRNPERIVKFLNCIKNFEGQKLTSPLIMDIVKKVIGEKLYKPTLIGKFNDLKYIFDSDSEKFSDDQLNFIIKNSQQKHKEAGFQEGWESRFDTWYKLSKEFGFVYYEKDMKIEISSSGHMLCDAYNSSSDNSGEKIQKIFLNALMKYQTNNPFRRNANMNAPIPLLLNVLKLLKDSGHDNGIHRKELAFLTCWNNNDHFELFNYIISFRNEFGFKASDEIIYERCLGLLKSKNRVRFKMVQIVKEGIDDLIRKLRITGAFSLRGMGRFVDINNLELENVNYIIDNYTDFTTFTNEFQFYSYMGSLDPKIMEVKSIEINDIDEIRIKALKNFTEQYSSEDIFNELELLQKNKASKDEYLKLIDSPTRLEFLTSIALLKKYPNYTIKPNYAIDDEGNPTFTAKGGIADIEVYDIEMDSLVEVTLMKNRQQATNEIPAITRHLKEQREKSLSKYVFSIFVAPNIHEDTLYMCEFTKFRDKLDIIPYTIVDFIKKIEVANSLVECIA